MENMITPSPLTFEQVMVMLDKRHQETLAKLEVEKQLHKEQMEEQRKEMEKRDKEIEEQRKESDRKFYELLEEYRRESDKKYGKYMRELTRRFGEIIEYMIAPDLCLKFRKYGFSFQQANTRQEISDGQDIITEIDILLEDGDSTMAVEVKTKPTMYDLKRHIKRMDEVKQYPPRSVRGTKLYGAIAGAVVRKEIRDAAFKAGFYVVSHSGENVNIIPPPDSFIAKCWDVTVTNV